MLAVFSISILAILLVGASVVVWLARRRHLDRWLGQYVWEARKRRAPRSGEAVHLLLCIGDHFEPRRGGVCAEVAQARVTRWMTEYPRLFGHFRDSDGRPPRHTFFYPMEKYEQPCLAGLAELCRSGFGEVEIHLHHADDTPAALEAKLLQYKETLVREHGLLSRDRRTGAMAYGFIHGNWALDNSLPGGQHCGVNGELEVLRQTGCFADFTLPAVPTAAQTRKINSIYYAVGGSRRCKSHDWGTDVGSAPPASRALMLIQGPLLLDWQRRKAGLLPRIENGCIQGNQPPNMERLRLWLKARIQVPGRPDWFFVKLHTHGAPPANADVLLGAPMVRFHEGLRELAASNLTFQYHYVTAREMFNLACAAAAGWSGTVADALDYQLVWNGGNPHALRERATELSTC
jgi:hypothetical protein